MEKQTWKPVSEPKLNFGAWNQETIERNRKAEGRSMLNRTHKECADQWTKKSAAHGHSEHQKRKPKQCWKILTLNPKTEGILWQEGLRNQWFQHEDGAHEQGDRLLNWET